MALVPVLIDAGFWAVHVCCAHLCPELGSDGVLRGDGEGEGSIRVPEVKGTTVAAAAYFGLHSVRHDTWMNKIISIVS